MADQLSQRIVYAGLRRMTENRSVIKSAYSHWLNELSNQEFDVLNVVNSLVDYLDLSGNEKKTLMIALHSASNKLIDELSPVPGVITGSGMDDEDQSRTNSTQNKTAEITTPHQLITQRYLQLFSQHMRRVDSSEFTDFRQAVGNREVDGLEASLSQSIASWAKDGMANLKLPNDISEEVCKSLAHEFYMLATNFIGPNQCDDISVKAVNECLDMDAATRFNPRSLV